MKTAESIAIDIRRGLTFYQARFEDETGKDYLTSCIKQIQIDAVKHGMTLAAEIVKGYKIPNPTTTSGMGCNFAVFTTLHEITTTRDNLKEL